MVEGLITQLGAQTTPRIEVFNKSDIYVGEIRPHGEDIVSISAKTGEGLDKLLEKIRKRLDTGVHRVTLALPYDKGGILDTLYREAKVESVEYGETIQVVAVCAEKTIGQIRAYVVDGWQPPRPSGRIEPWQNTTFLRGTAKRSSQRSAPASSATSGGWRARRRPGRKSPRPRPSTTMPGTTAGVTLSGRGASPATPTMGEPQGTAGQPMLEVFRREGVENVCCVVTRYFGGVPLGTGGLLRAYTRSAKDALEALGVAVVRQWVQTAVECPYNFLERVKGEIAAAQGILGEIAYGAQVRIPALPPVEHWEAYAARITELTGGKVAAEHLGETFQAAPMPPR